MAVDSYLKRMFGDDKVTKFKESKVLLVGAGGIGCELLKDLIMMNIGEIHVLDLDTIDLSNLNRQFLFRQKDIKNSKSMTAVKAVEYFNHTSKLIAYHGNIMDTDQFPLSFFKQFNIIYNALDNLEARFYVNKICLFTKTPLLESGTTGLKGQVQPIYPYLTECFQCIPKGTPKTFPVCTIRSTPSKPIHSITWSKNFLLPQLFGDIRDVDEPPEPVRENDFENKQEAEASMKEANELMELKKLIINRSDDDACTFIYKIIEKIFKNDIERLLRIEDLWKSREKPTPLDVDKYFKELESFDKNARDFKLSDQNVWNCIENLKILIKSILRLSDRFKSGAVIEFDKDDEDTLQFVVSSSNLRSIIFNIETKSEFEIKQIAGNIIPAVATTNAIMAGFSALTSINYYLESTDNDRVSKSKMIYDSSSIDRIVNSTNLIKPNLNCKACSICRGIVRLDVNEISLGTLRDELLHKYGYKDDVEIMTNDSRLLYDFDFEDNLNKKLVDFIKNGDVILISDSNEDLDLIELYVESDVIFKGVDLPILNIPPFERIEEDSEEKKEDEPMEMVNDGIIELDEKPLIENKRKINEIEINENEVKITKKQKIINAKDLL